jgi:hypothetical protein
MLVFSLIVALPTFGHRTVCRYNNTQCTYGVNPQHEGSISELQCAKSFFLACARTVQIFFAKNNIPTTLHHNYTQQTKCGYRLNALEILQDSTYDVHRAGTAPSLSPASTVDYVLVLSKQLIVLWRINNAAKQFNHRFYLYT